MRREEKKKKEKIQWDKKSMQLVALGHRENTYVFCTGEHGCAVGEKDLNAS